MERLIQFVLCVGLLCAASLTFGCGDEDNPTEPAGKPSLCDQMEGLWNNDHGSLLFVDIDAGRIDFEVLQARSCRWRPSRGQAFWGTKTNWYCNEPTADSDTTFFYSMGGMIQTGETPYACRLAVGRTILTKLFVSSPDADTPRPPRDFQPIRLLRADLSEDGDIMEWLDEGWWRVSHDTDVKHPLILKRFTAFRQRYFTRPHDSNLAYPTVEPSP